MPDDARLTKLERISQKLQDSLLVISEIERRQSSLLKEHSERIVSIEEQSAKYRARIEQNLAEITDKLNDLIGYVDGMKHPPQP